jgi:hypothetical protein
VNSGLWSKKQKKMGGTSSCHGDLGVNVSVINLTPIFQRIPVLIPLLSAADAGDYFEVTVWVSQTISNHKL